MRAKRAKQLRRYAEARTIGRSESDTRGLYRAAKRAYQKMQGGIRPPSPAVTTHYFGARQDRTARRSAARAEQERRKAQEAAA